MVLVQRFRETFNIAGITTTIEVDDEVHSQGDTVTGTVFLRGGDYDRSLEKITLQLREYWLETHSTGKSTTVVTVYRDEQIEILSGKTSINSGAESSHSFEVQLPPNCRITAGGCGYCLWAQLEIKGAVDPKCKVDFDVQPTESLMAIVSTCEDRMGFQEQLKKRAWVPKTSTVWFRLKPPDVLLSELDYLALDLNETQDGAVTGTLVFNLQEKSITDYFRAMLRWDIVKKPFALPLSDIFLKDGSIHQDAIVQQIVSQMRTVVATED